MERSAQPERRSYSSPREPVVTNLWWGVGVVVIVLGLYLWEWGDFFAELVIASVSVGWLTTIMLMKKRIGSEAQRTVALVRERTTAASQASQDLFLQVYQHSPVPYVLVHPDGSIESCNIAALRLIQAPESELLLASLFSFLSELPVEQQTILRERIVHRLPISDEEVLLTNPAHPDHRVWVSLSMHHFIDVYDRPLSLVTLFNVTKQKELDTARAEFVSLASHQLRTPLVGMKWNAELLTRDPAYPLEGVHAERAARLFRSIDRLGKLIDDFLSVSRFELGTLEAAPKPVMLDAFIKDLVLEQQPAWQALGHTIDLPSSPFGRTVLTDPDLLHMILGNFLSNAIKYTPAGGVIRWGIKTEGDVVSITVADTGIGIPVSEQSRLFTKMFRASNAQRVRVEGSGLGLYIAKRAAHILRGKISCASGEGVGSTFTLTLPLD
jgi:signal transduction histidine kinase